MELTQASAWFCVCCKEWHLFCYGTEKKSSDKPRVVLNPKSNELGEVRRGKGPDAYGDQPVLIDGLVLSPPISLIDLIYQWALNDGDTLGLVSYLSRDTWLDDGTQTLKEKNAKYEKFNPKA